MRLHAISQCSRSHEQVHGVADTLPWICLAQCPKFVGRHGMASTPLGLLPSLRDAIGLVANYAKPPDAT